MPPRGARQRPPEAESKPLMSLYHHVSPSPGSPASACLSADRGRKLHFKKEWRTPSGCIHQESCPSFRSRQSRPFSAPDRPQVASFAFLSIDRRCASPYRNLLTEALKCRSLPGGSPRFDDMRTMRVLSQHSCFGRTCNGWVLNHSSSTITR